MNKKYKPPRSAAITLIFLIIIILVILLIGSYILFGKHYFNTAAIILICVSLFSIAVTIQELRKIVICINDDDIILMSGIIISSERRIKKHKIELIYLLKTPFSKYTGLNFTVLCVYGKRLILPFMHIDDAKEIFNITADSIPTEKEHNNET